MSAHTVEEGSAVDTGVEAINKVIQFLTRDQIINAVDIVFENVEVPEWGGTIRVKSLTGDQVDAYQSARVMTKGESTTVNLKKARAQLVYMGAIDGQGNKLFSQADVDRLGRKSNKALERVADVIARISGLKKESIEQAGEDSGADPSADSTSD